MPKKVLPILIAAVAGALAPFTGGASLGLIALGAGISPAPKGVSMTLEPRGTG